MATTNATPQRFDLELAPGTAHQETMRSLKKINNMANPERFDEAQKQWSESLNIEDRRNEHVDAILDEMRRKKF